MSTLTILSTAIGGNKGQRLFLCWLSVVALGFPAYGCSPSKTVALKEALVKVEVAIEHGATLGQFNSIVLDAQTQFELAQPNLSVEASKSIEKGLEAVSAAQIIWQASVDPSCPQNCDAKLFPSMRRLNLLKNEDDFRYEKEKFFAESIIDESHASNEVSAEWSRVVARALRAADAPVKESLRSLN